MRLTSSRPPYWRANAREQSLGGRSILGVRAGRQLRACELEPADRAMPPIGVGDAHQTGWTTFEQSFPVVDAIPFLGLPRHGAQAMRADAEEQGGFIEVVAGGIWVNVHKLLTSFRASGCAGGGQVAPRFCGCFADAQIIGGPRFEGRSCSTTPSRVKERRPGRCFSSGIDGLRFQEILPAFRDDLADLEQTRARIGVQPHQTLVIAGCPQCPHA